MNNKKSKTFFTIQKFYLFVLLLLKLAFVRTVSFLYLKFSLVSWPLCKTHLFFSLRKGKWPFPKIFFSFSSNNIFYGSGESILKFVRVHFLAIVRVRMYTQPQPKHVLQFRVNNWLYQECIYVFCCVKYKTGVDKITVKKSKHIHSPRQIHRSHLYCLYKKEGRKCYDKMLNAISCSFVVAVVVVFAVFTVFFILHSMLRD